LDFVFTALKKKRILPYGYDYIIYQYAALLDYFEIILRQSTMMKQVEFMREKLKKKNSSISCFIQSSAGQKK